MKKKDLPEILLEEDDGSGLVKPENLVGFRGTFISIEKEGRTHILSRRRLGSHLGLFKYYRDKQDLYDLTGFVPSGGGEIEIRDKRIWLHGSSDSYGKYNREAVHSIIERFVQEYLPSHIIDLST